MIDQSKAFDWNLTFLIAGKGQDQAAQWAAYYAQYYAQAAAQQQPGQPQIPNGQGDGQPAAAAAQEGADYSAQWAAYYRAYGMEKEAQAVEEAARQMKAQQVCHSVCWDLIH